MEVDELYVGGKERNKHGGQALPFGRSPSGKQPVLDMRERGDKAVAVPVESTTKADSSPGLCRASEVEPPSARTSTPATKGCNWPASTTAASTTALGSEGGSRERHRIHVAPQPAGNVAPLLTQALARHLKEVVFRLKEGTTPAAAAPWFSRPSTIASPSATALLDAVADNGSSRCLRHGGVKCLNPLEKPWERLKNPLWLGFERLRSLAATGERESAVVRF